MEVLINQAAFNTEKIVRDAFDGNVLSREREMELAIAWRDSQDQEALDTLVSAYLRLVASISGKYARFGLSRDDLVQEGVFGLLQAAQKFDPERGFRFGTYAGWWVRAAIQRYMLDNWSIVKFATSHNRKKLFFDLRSALKKIEHASGNPSGVSLIDTAAAQLSVEPHEVEALMPMVRGQDMSLDMPRGEDGSLSLLELLEDETGCTEESVTMANTARARSRWLKLALNDLQDRDAHIVRRRYLGEERETLSAIAKELGVTKERVRQLEVRALARIRKFLEENFPGTIDEIISH
ncbi:MAG: RNA polymerase factor sigma-32 [Alphaproteobacteria bacterium]|nr:RNA polymerase factor sigma-32 [Alphaproteobacteria bacterium]